MNINFNRKSFIQTITDWGKVLILLLDEAVAILAVYLILHFLNVKIPLAVVITISVVAGIFVFFIHVAVIPSFHRKKVTGREGMIGEKGKVTEALNPTGMILVKGEYWNAEAVNDNIEVDKTVEVVSLEGLLLRVKRKEV